MHGIDEGELEIGPSGYYASSLLYVNTVYMMKQIAEFAITWRLRWFY
jgi:hypothetical protein